MRTEPPFTSFWFDCDSTLSSIEGVDTLCRHIPDELRSDIRDLTTKAMEGTFPLAKVYEQRLQMIAPSRADLDEAGRNYISNVVPHTRETVAALQFLGKTVAIISGGLRQPVLVLAEYLGVPADLVHAVPLLLNEDGSYRDFDRSSELWRNGGKPKVLGAVSQDQRPILFVGDGVTDLEAKDEVDLFVGFGGVERRERVALEADVYITDNSMAPVLDIGLSNDEKELLRQDNRFQNLLPDPRG